MALSRVASTKLRASSGNTASGSIGTVGAGNLLTCSMAQYQGNNGDLLASDNNGNTYTHLTSAHLNDTSSRIAYDLSANAGATTVTFTRSAPGTAPDGDVSEWTGATAWAFDLANRTTGTGTPASTGSITTTQAAEVVYTHCCFSGDQTPVQSSPWLLASAETDGSTYMEYNAAYQLPTATASFNGAWTFSGSIDWSGSIASFYDSGGGGGASGAAATRTGAQAQGVGLKAGLTALLGRIGALAQDVVRKLGSGTAAGRGGARGQHVGRVAATAAASGRAGAQAQTTGAPVGVRVAAGRTGAQAQCAGTSARVSTNIGRVGVQSQNVIIAVRTAAVLSQAGGRAVTSGSTTANEPHSGAAVARTGARGQCVGVHVASGASQGQAGARAAAVLLKRGTRTAVGRTGCQGVAVAGTAVRIGAAASQAGARGQMSAGQGITVPRVLTVRARSTGLIVHRRPVLVVR